MDDLSLLKDMANRTPLPSAADLAPARARLLTEASAEPTAITGATAVSAASAPSGTETVNGRAVALPTRRKLWSGRRRLVFSGVAVVGLAAAITGVVALGGLAPVGVEPAQANAAEVLQEAAKATRQLPNTPPRPDQFVYTRSKIVDGSFRETWHSADGTRDGLLAQQGGRMTIAGCRDGQQAVLKGGKPLPGLFEPCIPAPAYRQDLPTDVAGMLEFLSQDTGGEEGQPEAVNDLIRDAFAETYVPPAALAALFEAMAKFPGLTLEEHAKDTAGREGLGVSWTRLGYTTTLVFDRTTHALLGMSGSDAVVAQAIVDEAGQLP